MFNRIGLVNVMRHYVTKCNPLFYFILSKKSKIVVPFWRNKIKSRTLLNSYSALLQSILHPSLSLSLSLRFLLHQLFFFQGKFKSQIQSLHSNRSFFYFLRSVQILLFFHRSVNFLLFIDFFIWSCNFICAIRSTVKIDLACCFQREIWFSVRSGWISWYRCTLLMY